MPVFEFVGQYFFQNNVFKLQEVFSELEIRVFLENGWKFPGISHFTDLRQTTGAKKILRTVLKTRLKPKKPHTLLFS
jgi:hypothetical protein